jgi:hypothetical protein
MVNGLRRGAMGIDAGLAKTTGLEVGGTAQRSSVSKRDLERPLTSADSLIPKVLHPAPEAQARTYCTVACQVTT